MASKIKVDQIEGSTGSSITIPTGQTLTIADGLSASNITSGTVPIGRLGTSGTKDATTFLRGDNTFAEVGGGNMTPAFSVYLSGNQSIPDSVTTKIQFNTETLDSNSAFDTSNYDFTVPSGEGGKYFVHLRVYLYGSGNARMFVANLDLKHTPSGGSQTNYTGMKYYENSGELEDARSGSVSGIISLNAGDKISGYTSVSTNGASSTAEQSGTHFCGYKIIE